MPKKNDEPAFYRELGNRIQQARKRHVRKRRGLSQEELGHMVDLSRASISNIEGGRHQLKVFQLVKIAKVLGVSVEALVPSGPSIKMPPSKTEGEKDTATRQLDKTSLAIVGIARKRQQELENPRSTE